MKTIEKAWKILLAILWLHVAVTVCIVIPLAIWGETRTYLDPACAEFGEIVDACYKHVPYDRSKLLWVYYSLYASFALLCFRDAVNEAVRRFRKAIGR